MIERRRVYASSRRPRWPRYAQTTSFSVSGCGSTAGSTDSSRGQLLGEPLVQRPQAPVGLHAQQVRADDRDDPALLDVIEEIVPGVLVEILHHGQRSGHDSTLESNLLGIVLMRSPSPPC